jgi:hypothetical protein
MHFRISRVTAVLTLANHVTTHPRLHIATPPFTGARPGQPRISNPDTRVGSAGDLNCLMWGGLVCLY